MRFISILLLTVACAAPFKFIPVTQERKDTLAITADLKNCLNDTYGWNPGHTTKGCYADARKACKAKGLSPSCASTEIFWDCMDTWERMAHLPMGQFNPNAMPFCF